MDSLTPESGGAAEFELKAYLDGEVQRVERALGETVAALDGRVRRAVGEPLTYALGTQGKRIRPVLCVAAYRSVAGVEPASEVYRFACALEVVHTYSLVHDDLPCMDDDDLRRGRPTVHRVYGAAAATIAGAALLPLAVELLDAGAERFGLDLSTRGRLVVELCAAAGAEGMVGGQFMDLEGEARDIDGAALETIHRAKTGALLAASLRIGAIAGRAEPERLRALTDYGEALGLAFQIADDILDVTAETHALGKTAGKDLAVGKATYPALYGLDGARALARQRSAEAVAALRRADIESAPLEALARYVVERGK